LAPGAIEPNVRSVRDLARLASEMVSELGGWGGTSAIHLPDLAVVSAVFPKAAAGSAHAAADLAHRLPFPASEARSDFWWGAKGEALGAAVREAVVSQYEQVVEAADCRTGWIDAASLARIPAWAEASASEPESAAVRAQLYLSHYVLVLFRAGELVDIRTRLRSGDDADAVAAEIGRLSAFYDLPDLRAVVVSGEGASDCARLLPEERFPAGVSVEYDGEEEQLEAALSRILERA
jgi:hypothetical protein